METRPITVKRNPVPRVSFAIRPQGGVMPTDKQMAFIVALARKLGMKIDIAKISDKKTASQVIEKLKNMSAQIKGNSGGDYAGKGAAFGMATKLVFRRYCDLMKDPLNSNRFWLDVNYFYKRYQEFQERYANNQV